MKKRTSFVFPVLLSLFFILILASLATADPLHDAWTIFVSPVTDPASYSTTIDHHRARMQAISLLANSKEKSARGSEALGYFYLRDFQYQKARDEFEKAVKRNGKEPRVRFLLAQTKAILLLADPEKMGEQCKEPIGEFRKAASQESDNALPLLQAASVAFDCNRQDLALPLVTDALKRKSCRLYTVQVPTDLSSDPVKATAAWYWVQSGLWSDVISRMSNCARWLIQLGDRASIRGEYAEAQKLYQQAAGIADLLLHTTPPVATAYAAGLDIQKQSLTAQAGALEHSSPGDMAAVRTRLDEVTAKHKAFQQQWDALRSTEEAKPPATPQAIMENQRVLIETMTKETVPGGS